MMNKDMELVMKRACKFVCKNSNDIDYFEFHNDVLGIGGNAKVTLGKDGKYCSMIFDGLIVNKVYDPTEAIDLELSRLLGKLKGEQNERA